VHTYGPVAYEAPAAGPVPTRIHVTEAFSGGIDGTGIVEFLQSSDADGGASFVGIERATGTLRPARGLGRRQTSKSVDTRIFRALWCQISNASTV
jgi:hypothetical protein